MYAILQVSTMFANVYTNVAAVQQDFPGNTNTYLI